MFKIFCFFHLRFSNHGVCFLVCVFVFVVCWRVGGLFVGVMLFFVVIFFFLGGGGV